MQQMCSHAVNAASQKMDQKHHIDYFLPALLVEARRLLHQPMNGFITTSYLLLLE